MPNKKQNEIPRLSGNRAHEGVIQRRTDEGGGVGGGGSGGEKTRPGPGQHKYWPEEERKGEASIPLLFQLRSLRSQESSDKSSVVGLNVYNYGPYHIIKEVRSVCAVTHVSRDEYSVALILCQFYDSVAIAGIITELGRQSVDACSR